VAGTPPIAIDIRVEASIVASASVLFDLVAHLERMGEWSPENLGCAWVQGSPGQVGSRFVGHNRTGDIQWDSSGVIISAVAGRELAWAMGEDPSLPQGTWRYRFDQVGGVTRVEETYVLGPGPSGFRDEIAALPADQQSAAVALREAQLRAGMTTTLGRLKAHAERT
jgi:hypothetical protein